MSNEEYIQMYPHRFDDEIDKWLFKECNILGGCCSSVRSMEYSIGREIVKKFLATVESYVDRGNSAATEEFMTGLKQAMEA